MHPCEQLILERMKTTRLEYNRLHDILCSGEGVGSPLTTKYVVLPEPFFETKAAVYEHILDRYLFMRQLRACIERSRILREVKPHLPEEILYEIVTHDIKATDINLINN